jgi:hypothetical protein
MKPQVAADFKAELQEAIRLSHRLDILSSRRVEEILNGLIQRLDQKEDRIGKTTESNRVLIPHY